MSTHMPWFCWWDYHVKELGDEVIEENHWTEYMKANRYERRWMADNIVIRFACRVVGIDWSWACVCCQDDVLRKNQLKL